MPLDSPPTETSSLYAAQIPPAVPALAKGLEELAFLEQGHRSIYDLDPQKTLDLLNWAELQDAPKLRALSVIGLSPGIYRTLRLSRHRIRAALAFPEWKLWQHGQLNLPPVESKDSQHPLSAPATAAGPSRLPPVYDIRNLSARMLLQYMNLISAETGGGIDALDWALAHYNFPASLYHDLIGEIPKLTWAAMNGIAVLDARGKLELPRIPKGTHIGEETIPTSTPAERARILRELSTAGEQSDSPESSPHEDPGSPPPEINDGTPPAEVEIDDHSSGHRNVMDAILEEGDDEDFKPTSTEGFVPTHASPGTRKKIQVMGERVIRGNPVHHPQDRKDRSEPDPTLLLGILAPQLKRKIDEVFGKKGA